VEPSSVFHRGPFLCEVCPFFFVLCVCCVFSYVLHIFGVGLLTLIACMCSLKLVQKFLPLWPTYFNGQLVILKVVIDGYTAY
jgi:hypothetical protein